VRPIGPKERLERDEEGCISARDTFGLFLFVFGYCLERNERNGARFCTNGSASATKKSRATPAPSRATFQKMLRTGGMVAQLNATPSCSFLQMQHALGKYTFELDKQNRNRLTQEFALKSTPKGRTWSGAVEETGLKVRPRNRAHNGREKSLHTGSLRPLTTLKPARKRTMMPSTEERGAAKEQLAEESMEAACRLRPWDLGCRSLYASVILLPI
jgi:hypothetical protein